MLQFVPYHTRNKVFLATMTRNSVSLRLAYYAPLTFKVFQCVISVVKSTSSAVQNEAEKKGIRST